MGTMDEGIGKSHELFELSSKLVEVENWNKYLEQAVSNRTKAVRNLLDNVGQGLMTFGRDFLIHKDYSAECIRIFGELPEDRPFAELIFPDNEEESDFVNQVLHEVFKTNDALKTKVYLSMLPNEIKLGSDFINLEYKIIDDIISSDEKSVMVILTKITEKKLLEDQLREDERIIRMVANVAGNFNSFMEDVKEFQYFYGSKLHEILDSNRTVAEMYGEIYRYIHTFKGGFSQFEMFNSVENLHSMESALSCLSDSIESFTLKDFRSFVFSFDIIDFLEKDTDLLKEKLGAHFFSIGDNIQVEKSRLGDVEREIMEICSPVECKTLLPVLKSLRFKSLKELLSTYPEYTVKLAERLEKYINVFAIEGEDIYVDNEKYGSFIKSLIHVFRNSVDHGFASDGKVGNISCHIGAAAGYAEIVIEDDGVGIDFEKIRKSAVKYGLYDEKQAEVLDKDILLSLIFRENFSTKDSVTDISGRGMGLSAVKAEIEKLGGRLEVYTEKDKGTKLSFLIPLMDVEQIAHLEMEEFAEPVMNTTLDFLQEHFQSNFSVTKITPFSSSSFNMKNYTAFITIKGLFDGSFAISMDNSIAASLLKRMLIDNIDPHMETKYTKDVIAECANMILGNSIKSYPNIQELIIIGTPNVIHSTGDEISYDGNLIKGYVIETNQGTVLISIIQ